MRDGPTALGHLMKEPAIFEENRQIGSPPILPLGGKWALPADPESAVFAVERPGLGRVPTGGSLETADTAVVVGQNPVDLPWPQQIIQRQPECPRRILLAFGR